ncbi:hypothetical protein [Sphingomonas baiyangensis]|uniref:Glycerophosphoryl diester phosphodiesterase membrane domain-containing protein n=1 Tax=Sphingomonas baiyangensis TaxID=2572576 RepID=A0A4U1L2Z8_9SPHN|nr:hypothetical protein [Sphingomonas baiyangensis]TKD51271.1 hypothetical protein FBR43_11280 [Sphingomonas baiyangensis]
MVKMSNVWDRTTAFVSERAGAIAPIAILAIFLPTFASGLIDTVAPTLGAFARMFASLAGLLLMLVSLWASAALAALVIAPGGRSAAALATERVLPLVGVTLLLLIGAMLLVLPLVAILGVAGFDFEAAAALPAGTPPAMPDLSVGTAVAIMIYVLAMIPIGLWIVARLAVLTPVVVAERRGIGAIARSFALTRGHALRIVGVLLLYAIVTLVATMAVGAAFGAIAYILGGSEGTLSVGAILTSAAIAAVGTVLSVLQAVFVAKLYVALAPAETLADDFA